MRWIRVLFIAVVLFSFSGLVGEIVRPEEEHPPLLPPLMLELTEESDDNSFTILTEKSEEVEEPALLNEDVVIQHPDEFIKGGEEPLPVVYTSKSSALPIVEEQQEVAAAEIVPGAVRSLQIQWKTVFSGAPTIYSLLLLLSMSAFFICLYNEMRGRQIGIVSDSLLHEVRGQLENKDFDALSALCAQEQSLVCKILAAGVALRKSDLPARLEAMRAEGKRHTLLFWQRLSWLNDIALIAPLLGLLGTVLGMFYAFYDLNRSRESITSLFDGLGISVGTTVAGLVVAIAAMGLHALARYRLTNMLARVENTALAFLPLIEE